MLDKPFCNFVNIVKYLKKTIVSKRAIFYIVYLQLLMQELFMANLMAEYLTFDISLEGSSANQ